MMKFKGFERSDGTYGTRNYVSIIPSVSCANEAACAIAENVRSSVVFPHHQGCCQLRPDVEIIERTLVGFGKNPNTGAAIVVSLGCETVDANKLADAISETGKDVELIRIQELGGYSKTVRRGTKIERNGKMFVERSKKIRQY